MPRLSEHSARQESPGQFTTCRESKDKFGKGISPLFCRRRSDGKWVLQTIRFDKKLFTAEEAKAWCKDHGYSTAQFEPARKEGKSQV